MKKSTSTVKHRYRNELLPALQRLDRRLQQAVEAAQVCYGPDAATDRFRGLYIDADEIARLLARVPGDPVFRDQDASASSLLDLGNEHSGWAELAEAFELSTFDLDVLLIALAPELDLRYERFFAYLQDDVSCRRPRVDLALNLLCRSPEARLERRTHFAAGAPLIRHGVLHLIPDPNQVHPPLLAHTIKMDDQIVRFLLGERGLDRRLVSFCQWVESVAVAESGGGSPEEKQPLEGIVGQARQTDRPLRLYFQRPPGVELRHMAAALAVAIRAPLIAADLARAPTRRIEFERHLDLMFREARLQRAVLYLEGLEALHDAEHELSYRALLHRLSVYDGHTILSGTGAWVATGPVSLGIVTVPFRLPEYEQRLAIWQARLGEAGLRLDKADVEALAARFRLTPDQIAEAVATAQNSRTVRDRRSNREEVFSAARSRSGHALAALAHRIEPTYTWGDLVLPEDAMAQLREICQRVAHRHRVLNEWGFVRRLSHGTGTTALFAGPSGTGKTMAAEVIAGGLGLDLYRIDLSGVVSKYIGETEKNLDRVFRSAEHANAILFFDEADALFGKRSEVRDAHDRYANIEISYLLQKMEDYEGLAILATNLRQNLDDAFTRRLAFTVYFPFPDEPSRRRIWHGIWPAETPLADDVDLEFLAHRFRLSGGHIKNVALAAAFLAVEAGTPVMMAHLLQAMRREYQKMGKVLTEADLNGHPATVSSGTGDAV